MMELFRLFRFVESGRHRRDTFRAAGLAFIPAVAALIVAGAGCSPQTPASAETARHPRKVEAAQVTQVPMDRTVSVHGSLLAFEHATLSAKVAGRIEEIPVDLGTVVKQGDVLAKIERRDYELKLNQAGALLSQARVRLGLSPEGDDDAIEPEETSIVRQARALLNEARGIRNRLASLNEAGIVSHAELERAESAHVVALNRYQDSLEEARQRQAVLAQRRAEVDIARDQLADTVLRAPFDGAVVERRANRGEYMSPGSPVVSIVRMTPLRLRVDVPERHAWLVRPGQIARVMVEGDPRIHTGEITRLSPSLHELNRVLAVEADVPNDGTLRPGSFARAEIVVETGGLSLAIPAEALQTFAGLEKVFVIENGKASERMVTTGRRSGNQIEVLKGVSNGEVVVLDPGNLRTGEAVVTGGGS